VSRLADLAATLRELHRPGDPVVLPNAWDPPSARRLAVTGAAALATTSVGVAETLGYEDGEATPGRGDARGGRADRRGRGGAGDG